MSEPSDLEIVRACAEAMGLTLLRAYEKGDLRYCGDGWNGLMFSLEPPCLFTQSGAYDPLHDDAQAMALVKKFELEIRHPHAGTWWVMGNGSSEDSAYLNRAICLCVARMKGER